MIAREIGDRFREGKYSNNHGLLYETLGNYPVALEHFHGACQVFEAIDAVHLVKYVEEKIARVVAKLNE